MHKEPLISVIIPVYNSAIYLEECLNSLRLQTYKNLEFICVNDGSVDNSGAILEKYKQEDERFVVINQQNGCASAARNKGLKFAKGEYISFVDSDDRVSLSLYQKFANIVYKPDVYIFNACEYDKTTKNVFPRYFFSLKEWNNHKDDNTMHTFDDNINPFHGNMSAVNKIFRADFLKSLVNPDTELFLTGCIFEDQYFFFLTMIHAKTIMINQDPLYYYRMTNQNSVTQNISSKVFDIFKITDKIETMFKDSGLYDSYKYAFFQHKYKQYSALFFRVGEAGRHEFYEEMQKRLKRYETEEKLDSKICEKLVLYGVYKNIIKLNADEFFEKYNGKITNI